MIIKDFDNKNNTETRKLVIYLRLKSIQTAAPNVCPLMLYTTVIIMKQLTDRTQHMICAQTHMINTTIKNMMMMMTILIFLYILPL